MGTSVAVMGRQPQQVTFFGTWALDGAAVWGTQVVLVSAAIAVVMSPG
ncbi:MAG: hypothetical protein ACRDU8_02670 [Egibacteraceae bacterium]